MKAVLFDRYGGPDVLRYTDAPDPVPKPGEVLIRVTAIGVNPADGKWRSGMLHELAPISFPHIGGYDVAGVVVGGDGFPIGARIVAMIDTFRSGAYAELAVAASDRLARLPDGIDFATGAALPTPGLTGFQMIAEGLDVLPGQRVLVTGAIGAVGRFALHSAKERGAFVVAAVRAEARDAALSLGADEVIALGERYAGAPFDRIADTVGGAIVAPLCAHLAPDAIVNTVSTLPIPAEGLPKAIGFFMVHPDAVQLENVVAAVAAGRLDVPIADRLPLSRAAEAQARVDAGGTGGRIILIP